MVPNYNLTDQVAQLQSQLAQLGQFQPQPFMPQPQTMVQPVVPARAEVKRVNGIEGAKEFQKNLAPNSNDVVFDNEKDVFYLVMKDANGISPEVMTYGEFTLHKEESKESNYATKEDLNLIMEEIRKLSEALK
jgi:hypothetical protein